MTSSSVKAAAPPTTALETVVLTHGKSRAFIAPARGGMLTRFFVDDHAVLYLDETTLLDPTKNVRGGSPILFPSPGKLDGDAFTYREKSGKMGQHGFARNLAWTVTDQKPDEVTLRLASSDETRAVYPWDFVATYRYSLREGVVRIDQTFETTDDELPFGAGFHPYFAIPQAQKGAARVKTRAARAWDNHAKEVIDVPTPIDLTLKEVDLHLLDHDASNAVLDFGDGGATSIEVRGSKAFKRWVVWTLEGKDFVCLEPWTCPANALNAAEDDLLMAYKTEPVTLWTEIELRRS